MHPAFASVDHRPWPPPARRWWGRQTWEDLLFAHWPVPAAMVRRLVPDGLQIDEHDGTSWVGVVPFRMTGVSARLVPPLPGLSSFPETNVRLYVTRGGKRGVWFLSLDAASRLAVWGGQRLFHLPYHRARMSVAADNAGRINYRTERVGTNARLQGVYGPAGSPVAAAPGSLAHFLTERYCLYATAPDGTLHRTEIHHLPWPLQPARATIEARTLLAAGGVDIASPPPVLHFARHLDVVVWSPERLAL